MLIRRHGFTSLTAAALVLTLLCAAIGAGSGASGQGVPACELPGEWLAAWDNPPAGLRPLQIVHGLAPSQATTEAMRSLKDLGLGGIVCNVSFDRYLTHEPHWRTLVEAVRACEQVGLIVWIYDEKGYPSGTAGGLVLKDNRDLEALALAYDPTGAERFIVRPSYEYTHASNNFHAARRYTNLLDGRATRRFIETTHDAYFRRLEPFFGKTIVALFTDEPSLMAVNIGALPDEIRRAVRVEDGLDPNVKPLASVPWARDMAELYRQRYGSDLTAVRRSLFEGGSDADREVRRNFWSLVSELLSQRYYGQIGRWAREHRVASSGHILWEEMPLHGVPLEGNPLQMLMQMEIPGLDMLSSDPEAVVHSGWLTAALPCSAAIFNGGRKVMTEVSDFVENMAKTGPARVAEMRAAAAWQAALGVSEFTLYYNRSQHTPEDYRAYCGYVGRLNAVLREAKPAATVLLYYPIFDLWAEYIPIGGVLSLQSQPARMQQVVGSFMSLGQQMVRRQISFALADHRLLSEAQVKGGVLQLKGRAFDALVLPAGVEMPASAAQVVAGLKAAGLVVLADGPQGINLDGLPGGDGKISPPSDRIVVGRFSRGGRDILLVVNVGLGPYSGTIRAQGAGGWLLADPASGRVEAAKMDAADRIIVSLPARASMLLVGPAR